MVNCSQGLVLATTAMIISTTVAVLAYSRQKSSQEQESSSPQNQPLRSCLCSSDEGRRGKRQKKKRVRFAEDVFKEPMRDQTRSNDVIKGDGLDQLQSQAPIGRGVGCSCRDEFGNGVMPMPANRVALYSWVLRDRANRMACSY